LRQRDPRERQLLKNIVYVGVLAAMLGVEPEVIATLLGEQYKGKAKLLQPNLDAFMMGLHHGREYFDDALGLRIERRDAVGKRIFIEGNAAAALGCVYGGATDAATNALRLRSTRALWDPTYSDESWIAEPVQLIPRMRGWVAADYPGTKISISEYNWGALGHFNGALAQADVLGIFGRENLDLATLWDPPQPTQPGAYAFRVFHNFDGGGAEFGRMSVGATSTDQSQVSIYAADRGASAFEQGRP
jgi:hypothetical protein